MLIREPKYADGDKVVFIKNKECFTIVSVNTYDFDYDLYEFTLKDSDGELAYLSEDDIKPFIDNNVNEPDNIWNIQKGNPYYRIVLTKYGFRPARYDWSGSRGEIFLRDIGDVFLTQEEAEFEIECRKVKAQMFRFGGHKKYDYKGNNFCFSYDQEKDSVNICLADFGSAWQPCEGIYFSKREEAEKALIEIGEDKIIKYLFFSIDESEKTDD